MSVQKGSSSAIDWRRWQGLSIVPAMPKMTIAPAS
jgi:hypothetical protein